MVKLVGELGPLQVRRQLLKVIRLHEVFNDLALKANQLGCHLRASHAHVVIRLVRAAWLLIWTKGRRLHELQF